MIEKLINKITDKFYDHQEKDKEEIEVFKYGLEAIISSVMGIGIAILVCSIVKEGRLGTMFILLLTPIKLVFTSYHCNHRYTCFMTYATVVLTNVYLYYYMPLNILLAIGALCMICILKRKELTTKTCFIIATYLLCLFLFDENWKQLLSLVIYTELLLIIMLEIKKAYYNLKKTVVNQAH